MQRCHYQPPRSPCVAQRHHAHVCMFARGICGVGYKMRRCTVVTRATRGRQPLLPAHLHPLPAHLHLLPAATRPCACHAWGSRQHTQLNPPIPSPLPLPPLAVPKRHFIYFSCYRTDYCGANRYSNCAPSHHCYTVAATTTTATTTATTTLVRVSAATPTPTITVVAVVCAPAPAQPLAFTAPPPPLLLPPC